MTTPENTYANRLALAAQDKEHQDATLVEVRADDVGGWTVTRADGFCFWLQNTIGVLARAPQVGDRIRFFGRGIGYCVRGAALLRGDVVAGLYSYETEEEHEAARLAQIDREKRERRERFDAKRAVFDADLAALPEPLRERMTGFVNRKSDAWLYAHGDYEMFCCKEAAKIASACSSEDAIAKLASSSAEQARVGIDAGHSGGTFAASIGLARMLLRENAAYIVPRAHAAICRLVGCETAGCWATVAGEEARA